ncbi:MAG TPA: hypothetical protein VHE81_18530 [Lacipirellulaceae bacterium]|nr:hypothetical protein [Lacipirellulaceae bacterium]
MSDHPLNSDWLERALESARRRVRQVEIDACRIRTDLAQLEVTNAASVIDSDVAGYVREDLCGTRPLANDLHDPATEEEYIGPSPEVTILDESAKIATLEIGWQPAATPLPDGMDILVSAPMPTEMAACEQKPEQTATEHVPEPSNLTKLAGRPRHIYRRPTSPLMASLLVHGAVLFLAASVTVATIDRIDPQFAPTVLDLSHEPAKKSVEFDPHELADLGKTGIHKALADLPKFDGLAALDQPPMPIDLKSLDGPVSLGRAGLPDMIPTEPGTLMNGAGGASAAGHGAPIGLGHANQRGGGRADHATSPRTARAGNRSDSTFFFGTQAKGNRFVFIVDNSSSMKGGRLEMAVAELIRTVDSLTARQSFYVIFVSDQTYPMFYPQQEPTLALATNANKKRLAEWAPKAILASGKNRELIKAMDMAAALQPQAVYLLWDGDLRYSEKVRFDVLNHLTQHTAGWNFVVHTLGMGITSLDSEQNLRMIAQAHGGIYRRIDIPKGRTR